MLVRSQRALRQRQGNQAYPNEGGLVNTIREPSDGEEEVVDARGNVFEGGEEGQEAWGNVSEEGEGMYEARKMVVS